MIKHKHMRLDDEKIRKAKEILHAKTETEAVGKAIEKAIRDEQERAKRRMLMKRIIELRDRIGKIHEDPADWVRSVRKQRS